MRQDQSGPKAEYIRKGAGIHESHSQNFRHISTGKPRRLDVYPKRGSSRAWLVLIARLGLGWPTTATTTTATTTTTTGLVLPFAFRAILGRELRFPGVTGRLLTASPVAGCGLNLQFVKLVPFSVGTIAVWYVEQLTYPAPRIKRGRGGSRRWVDFVLQWIPVQSVNLSKGNLSSSVGRQSI